MNARVLLTGALGFVGRHCAATLRDRGYEVIGSTSRAQSDASEICSRLETADLTDPARARDTCHWMNTINITPGIPLDHKAHAPTSSARTTIRVLPP